MTPSQQSDPPRVEAPPGPTQEPRPTDASAADADLDEALDAELGPVAGPAAGPPADEVGAAAEAPTSGEVEGEPASGPELDDDEVERSVAALLFASPEALSSARLGSLLGGVPRKRVETGLEALSRRLEASGLPFELRSIAGGWQLFTTPDQAETVGALSRVRRDEKVSPAALETLAVVAYRQPVTKAEVEAIRGVQVGPILRSLVDRGLVRVTGRSPEPGHPLLYGTTRRFLDVFGLAGLDDLPRDGELLRD